MLQLDWIVTRELGQSSVGKNLVSSLFGCLVCIILTRRSYDCDLTFPIPDSFPPIYLAKADGLPVNKSIKVNTRLGTDTSISNDLKSLRSLVVPVISSLERESLGNRLAELQEAYNDGWASDSDDDDD